MRTYANIGLYRNALSNFPFEKVNFKSILRYFVGLLFSFCVWADGDFKGEILYFSNISEQHNRDLKIFSAHESKIRILFANKVRALLYCKNREKADNKFPVTKLYEYNEDELYAIDEYIIKKKDENVSIEIVGELFDFYLKYYSQCKERCDFVKQKEYELHNECDLSLNECPILFLSHADLSKDNYIYTDDKERKFVFIDFDHSDYYPPFYDMFFLILNQLTAYGDYNLINALNDGVYDKYLTCYAEENGIGLNDIYTSCLKCLWHKRLYMLDEKSKKEVIEIFCEMVKKVKGRLGNV